MARGLGGGGAHNNGRPGGGGAWRGCWRPGVGGTHSTYADTCVHNASPIVNLWRVVVPRGGPEPPQPPPPGPEFWGYAPSWPPGPPPPHHQQQQPHIPQPQRPMKRTHSESDDQDDPFSEESSKDQCSSPGDADSCQMLSRKKRRGIIEKRRRDRINTSLLELRRLVPSAFEKQGSAKLEKAEILQMTVDHLKSLHAKGVENNSYDPSKVAMDYHSIGFRECAAEVARYLVSVEGLDCQDPLRLRLMSHLQCFAAQRELSKPWEMGTSGAKPWTDTSGSSSGGNSSFECEGSTLTPLTPAPPPPYHYPQHYPQEYSTNSSQQKPYRPWGGTEMAY